MNWSTLGFAHQALQRQRRVANATARVMFVFIQLRGKLHHNVLREGFFTEKQILKCESLSIFSVNCLRAGSVYLQPREQCGVEIASCFKPAQIPEEKHP